MNTTQQQDGSVREYEVECNRCGFTRLVCLQDGSALPPCRAPHPHSTQASPAECGGTSFDVKPTDALPRPARLDSDPSPLIAGRALRESSNGDFTEAEREEIDRQTELAKQRDCREFVVDRAREEAAARVEAAQRRAQGLPW